MDLYVILGIERAATPGDIKRAYKRLARRCHPDINPGDQMAATHFRQIAAAYETLIDPSAGAGTTRTATTTRLPGGGRVSDSRASIFRSV